MKNWSRSPVWLADSCVPKIAPLSGIEFQLTIALDAMDSALEDCVDDILVDLIMDGVQEDDLSGIP